MLNKIANSSIFIDVSYVKCPVRSLTSPKKIPLGLNTDHPHDNLPPALNQGKLGKRNLVSQIFFQNAPNSFQVASQPCCYVMISSAEVTNVGKTTW